MRGNRQNYAARKSLQGMKFTWFCAYKSKALSDLLQTKVLEYNNVYKASSHLCDNQKQSYKLLFQNSLLIFYLFKSNIKGQELK